jgi:lysophospholipase L1-like esterase
MKTRSWREILVVALGLGIGFLLAEAGARVFFALGIGPRVLLYGTNWYRNVDPGEQDRRAGLTDKEKKSAAAEFARKDSVEVHGRDFGTYTKFFPGERKTTKDVDSGERISVTINGQGFRGREFTAVKAPGVVRVLTLGASSTFGYYNRDDETYPVRLEQQLNEACGGTPRFEVINFAIPHASSGNIAAMFLAEGIALGPDVVTFYEGRNDSTLVRKHSGMLGKLHSVLVHRLLLVAFIDQLVIGERASITDHTLKFAPHAERVSRLFLDNLATILEASRAAGIQLIVANQQATSRSPLPGAPQERLALRGVTFDQEADEIARRMDRKESVSVFEYSLLVCRRLMQDLRQWAAQRNVPFADVIKALDQDRHHLLSWVHLHPDANRVVAATFAEPILRRYCPAARAAPG